MNPVYKKIVPKTEGVKTIIWPSACSNPTATQPVRIVPKLDIQAAHKYYPGVVMNPTQTVVKPASTIGHVSSVPIKPKISPGQAISRPQVFKIHSASGRLTPLTSNLLTPTTSCQLKPATSEQTTSITSGRSILGSSSQSAPLKPSKQVVRYINLPVQKQTASFSRATTPKISTTVNTLPPSLSKPQLISSDLKVINTGNVRESATIAKKQLDKIRRRSTNSKETEAQTVSSPVTQIFFKRPKSESISKTNVSPIPAEISSDELSDEEKEPQTRSKTQGTQTEMYSCLYDNDKLYLLDEANSNGKFLPVDHTDCIPSKKPTTKSIGTDTVDLQTELTSRESNTSSNSYEPKSAYEENLYTTLGLYSRPEAQPENHHLDLNPLFLETSQSQQIESSESLYGTQCPNLENQKTYSENMPVQSHMMFQQHNSSNINPTFEISSLQERGLDINIPPQIQNIIQDLKRQINSCLEKDDFGDLPIHQAVKNHDWMKLKSQCIVLKSIKSHLDHVNNEHETALLLAVLEQVRMSEGVCEGVTILLAEGASQRVHDAQGCFPLHHAVQHAHVDLVKVLLAADDIIFAVNRCNDEGLTPLHLATMMNHAELIQLLVSAGADHSIKDRKSGKTAYFVACEKGHVEAATMLASLGADSTTPNYAGQPPPLIEKPSSMGQEEITKKQPITKKKRSIGKNKTDEVMEPDKKRFRYVHDTSSVQDSNGESQSVPRRLQTTASLLLKNQPSPDSCVLSDQEYSSPNRSTMSTTETLKSTKQINSQKSIHPLISQSTSNTLQHHKQDSNTASNASRIIRFTPNAMNAKLLKEYSVTKDDRNFKRKGMIYIGDSNKLASPKVNSTPPSKEKSGGERSSNQNSVQIDDMPKLQNQTSNSNQKPKNQAIQEMFQISYNEYYENVVNKKNKLESNSPVKSVGEKEKATQSQSKANTPVVRSNGAASERIKTRGKSLISVQVSKTVKGEPASNVKRGIGRGK